MRKYLLMFFSIPFISSVDACSMHKPTPRRRDCIENILVQYKDDPEVEMHVMSILEKMDIIQETMYFSDDGEFRQVNVRLCSSERTEALAAQLAKSSGVGITILGKNYMAFPTDWIKYEN